MSPGAINRVQEGCRGNIMEFISLSVVPLLNCFLPPKERKVAFPEKQKFVYRFYGKREELDTLADFLKWQSWPDDFSSGHVQ